MAIPGEMAYLVRICGGFGGPFLGGGGGGGHAPGFPPGYFVPCKSYSSSHRPSPGKRDEEKSQINAFYETVVAARGRDVLGPPDGS